MNTNRFKIFAALLGLIVVFAACQPEEYELGTILSKNDLKFSITQDPTNPNLIILESQTPGAAPLWQTPMGRSTRMKDEVKIPFAGKYAFIYGVTSAGGYVQADTIFLDIATNNLSYVNDPLWTNLTGGVGHEKTWRLDYGKYGIAAGPLTYCEPQTTWIEWQSGTAKIGWAPSWSDNSWIIEEADTASRMTFSLIGGAFLRTHKITEGVDESGTFFLNTVNHTISTTDATILRSNNFIANASNWNNDLVVLALTENQLMIGVRRTNSEGDYLYAWNFVSEEYAKNYVPADLPDPEPTLPSGWKDDISKNVTYAIKWVLSPETPFNWCNLDGSFMNAWNAVTDYPDWTGFNASVPASYASFSLTLNSEDNSVAFIAPDGTTQAGTYELDEKGIYTFTGVKPSFNICSWVNLNTTAENQWRIMQVEKNAAGMVTGMWVGARDAVKSEYMAFHLVPQAAGGVDPIEAAKKVIIKALCGTSSKSFKMSDTWFVDWCAADYTGGWTSAATFADFTSNTWLWTEEVKQSIQEPRLTFSVSGSVVTCTKTQDGVTTSSTVTIDPENNTITMDMDLIKPGGAANWLPSLGPTWKICRNELSVIDTDGLWLGIPNPGKEATETVIFHYEVAN